MKGKLKYNIQRLNEKLINIGKLSKDEIIIISVIIGIVLAIITGYIFGDTQYFYSDGERVYITEEFNESIYEFVYKKNAFNYILSIASFIIISGFTYLFLNRRKDDDKNVND